MDDAQTIETALAAADAHAQRINHVPSVDMLRNAQQSKTFSVDSSVNFDDPDEEDEDEDVPEVVEQAE